jgi:ubiquinone/menaquinone biosynthesis C-methylase UbiE
VRTASAVFDSAARVFDECCPASPEILNSACGIVKSFGAIPVRTLDVGCGTGTHSIPLAERFPNIRLSGIDVSGEMVLCSRKKFPNATWVQGDFFSTDLPARGFDLVLAINSIHLMNWRQFVLRCNRITSQKGKVLVVTGDRADYSNIYYEHVPLFMEKDLLHYPRVKQLRLEFERLGFKTDCRKIEIQTIIKTAEDAEAVLKKARLKADSVFHLVDEACLNACISELEKSIEKQVAMRGFALAKETLYAVEAVRSVGQKWQR